MIYLPDITKTDAKKDVKKNTDKSYSAKANTLRTVPPNLKGLNNGNSAAFVGSSYTKLHSRALRTVKTTAGSGTTMLGGISALFDTTGNSMRRIVDKMKAFAKEHSDQVDKFREIKQREKSQIKAQRSANIEAMRSNIMSGMMAEYQKNKNDITFNKDTLDELDRVEKKSKELSSDDLEYNE